MKLVHTLVGLSAIAIAAGLWMEAQSPRPRAAKARGPVPNAPVADGASALSGDGPVDADIPRARKENDETAHLRRSIGAMARSHPDPAIRRQAVLDLADRFGDSSRGILSIIADQDPDPGVRDAAADALMK